MQNTFLTCRPPVCLGAKQMVADTVDIFKYQIGIVHLGNLRTASQKRKIRCVISAGPGDKRPGFHINFGATIDALKQKGEKMNEVAQKKDYFWVYVGSLTAILVTVIVLVKESESEKYSKIQKLEDEEKALMNIRVVS